jgi:hypothetical protein
MTSSLTERSLQDLIDWHHAQATIVAKAASVTAMDYPELTTQSLERLAQWHQQQVQLLKNMLRERVQQQIHDHVFTVKPPAACLDPIPYERR